METSPTDPAPPPQPSDNDSPAPEQPSNSQQPQAADPPSSPRPPEVVLSDLSSDDDAPPPKKPIIVSKMLTDLVPYMAIKDSEYVQHPTHPYIQPEFEAHPPYPRPKEDMEPFRKHLREVVAPVMKEIAMTRWPIHYSDILQEMFPGSDGKDVTLAEDHVRYVYFQCLRRTKADLFQTPIFKTGFQFICRELKLFQRFQILCGEVGLSEHVCPKDYVRLYMLN